MYYAISTDLNMYKISNAENVPELISKKNENPHWYLSINDGKLSTNPCTPLFIYGARLVVCIIQDGKIIYNEREKAPTSDYWTKAFNDVFASQI